ncbi:helix-turn-helix domain-containing protein [Streptomyces sp. VRA16 Mangrove soil]|uniref:helix-turn-helix domain-containing protein n=1 Tax=Streptomyces sp. VRA16 Mangrove soil TaxID=2817434 RepID=UPI001A9F1CBD|nr:helix-turn-helix transcriptional regulator [Streptomyces sp. VRA16 Mangrove soil]MBO1332993.1 helix-turn-helix transcriptional regulator [Streptomyces sp. VRA16 Mangrove soil]
MSAHETRSPRVAPAPEPLWRHVVGDVLRRRRRAQGRTLQDVADVAGISMPYLSEVERGRKEASSEMLAAVAGALGLGLVDVLALAQGELARAAQVRRAVPVTPVTTVASVTSVAAVGARRGAAVRGQGTVCLAA